MAKAKATPTITAAGKHKIRAYLICRADLLRDGTRDIATYGVSRETRAGGNVVDDIALCVRSTR